MKRSLAALALILAFALNPTSSARAEVIERVIAVVNDEAIFLSELRRRSLPYLDRVMSAPSQAERVAGLGQLYSELLEQMIDHTLIEQAAQRMTIRVSTSDVDRAVANVIRENGLTDEQFWEAVRGQGFTEAQYRADVRRQILRLKVINTRVRGRVNITESDVRGRYDERVRQANRRVRVRASHVFMALPADASAADLANARREAQAVRARLTVENFTATASEYGGGELGWLSEGELPSVLEDALVRLEAGQISDPVRGSTGFHIFLLHERERGGADLPAFEEVKGQLQQQMMARAMERQEQTYLEELRRDAIVQNRL